ncbi:MAG: Protein serine/threonine phosphatase PrpC, regulation of stationary phase [Evtepia sp.]|jgi:protein phosphatase|nr:Protein serine/threonine phosphatase PrpC, regulation of stationary phase [Evtepia sp.]
MISVFGITDRGMLRRENQDAFSYEMVGEDRAWGVVCDGMGGARAGDIASRIGVEVFQDHMIKYHECETQDNPTTALNSAVEEGNRAILYYANSDRECFGMGTTLVGAIVQGLQVYVINIGDSRAYHISTDTISRVTRDHSIVEALVERGNITPEQARQHPQKNLITRALGTSKTAQADVYELKMQYGDWLLLCSDGLINEMPDEEILQVISQGDPTEICCQHLLEIVLDRGAPDNVTILLFHLEAKE